MVDFYKRQERIRAYYYRNILRLFKDLLKNINLSEESLQIVKTITEISQSYDFNKFVSSFTNNLFAKIEIENAKDWREAVLKSNKPNDFYKYLIENTRGQIAGLLQSKSLENANLIKTIPSLFAQKATEFATEEYLKGNRADVVKNKILNMYSHLTEVEAQRIARTEVSKTSTQLVQIRSQAVGLDWYVWRTSKDRRVRHSHDIMEGVLVNFNNPPNPEKLAGMKESYGVYNAGEIFNCFSGDTVIFSPVRNQKIFRHSYSGEFINLITDINRIKVTPNHPILTGRGWFPAKDIQIGDEVIEISEQFPPIIETNPNHTKPTFEQLFRLYSIFGNVERVTPIARDFHGDISVNDQVDIITLERKLTDYVKPEIDKVFLKDIFTEANKLSNVHTGNSPFLDFFPLPSTTPDSIVSLFNKAFTLLFGSVSHSVEHTLTSVSWLYSITNKCISYGVTGTMENLSKLLNASPASVKFYQLLFWELYCIVSNAFMVDYFMPSSTHINGQITSGTTQLFGDFVKIFPVNIKSNRIINKFISEDFNTHVYNLENSIHYYFANNILSHNCRCYTEPVVDINDISFPAKVYHNGRIIKMRKADFLKIM